MSQVYESEKDCVEGRGLDSRVGKSCILDNHLWTRIGRVWESQYLYIFFSWTIPCWKKESTMWSVTFSYVCLFISNCHQCLLWYYPTPNSMSFTFYYCWEMSLSWEDLTYEILSMRERWSPYLVIKCRGILWLKSLKGASSGHTTWYWEPYA